MELKFWGAARTVTGSSHLLTINGRRVLLDCGLFQGSRQIGAVLNREFAVPPESVDAMVLSHAHIDHAGNIPQLVSHGFKGPIFCTNATADLSRIMLRDSGKIHENDAETLNRRLKRQGKAPITPLYTLEEAERALPQFRPRSYNEPIEVIKDAISVQFHDAGHMLGSSFVQCEITDQGRPKRLLFSGDLGRKNMPILRDPESPAEADWLIMESTYGNRRHTDYALAEQGLCDAISRVVRRGGKVVIPAFSVGRTQEIVYALNNLWNSGKLERVPVYVDSPLSANATEVFRHHPECYDDEIKSVFVNDPDPFGFEGLIYVRDTESSKRINLLTTPCIIISSSGMCEAGRVLHHLANNVGDPRNAVIIVGFQAENTLGRKLVNKEPEVSILGERHKVAAEVIVFNAFSGHADSEELRTFAHTVAESGRLKKIFLVHGEEEAMLALQTTLRGDLPKVDVEAPSRGQAFVL